MTRDEMLRDRPLPPLTPPDRTARTHRLPEPLAAFRTPSPAALPIRCSPATPRRSHWDVRASAGGAVRRMVSTHLTVGKVDHNNAIFLRDSAPKNGWSGLLLCSTRRLHE